MHLLLPCVQCLNGDILLLEDGAKPRSSSDSFGACTLMHQQSAAICFLLDFNPRLPALRRSGYTASFLEMEDKVMV